MNLLAMLILTLPISQIAIGSTDVQDLKSCEKYIESCDYYACINTLKSCGKRSYFEKFGKKYCNKFSKVESKFSSNGKNWIDDTKLCLIASIEQLDESLSCSQYKKLAIKQHVPCYVNSGYCSLSKSDKLKVTKTIIGSMWRPSLVKSALKVLSACKK